MNVSGFSYNDWYTMPIYLRNFYIDKISKTLEKRNTKGSSAVDHLPNVVKKQLMSNNG